MKNTKFSKILKELYKLVGSKLPKEFVSKVLAKPKKTTKGSVFNKHSLSGSLSLKNTLDKRTISIKDMKVLDLGNFKIGTTNINNFPYSPSDETAESLFGLKESLYKNDPVMAGIITKYINFDKANKKRIAFISFIYHQWGNYLDRADSFIKKTKIRKRVPKKRYYRSKDLSKYIKSILDPGLKDYVRKLVIRRKKNKFLVSFVRTNNFKKQNKIPKYIKKIRLRRYFPLYKNAKIALYTKANRRKRRLLVINYEKQYIKAFMERSHGFSITAWPSEKRLIYKLNVLDKAERLAKKRIIKQSGFHGQFKQFIRHTNIRLGKVGRVKKKLTLKAKLKIKRKKKRSREKIKKRLAARKRRKLGLKKTRRKRLTKKQQKLRKKKKALRKKLREKKELRKKKLKKELKKKWKKNPRLRKAYIKALKKKREIKK